MNHGVLSSQQIEALLARRCIVCATPPTADQLQPASLDLRLGTLAYRVRASFLAGSGRSVKNRLRAFAMHKIDLSRGAVLEKGCVYLVPLQESLALEPTISATANAKSSTGRLDLLTRLITDGGAEFDRVRAGYRGPLYAEICPRSFSVLVRPGVRLNQLRFQFGHARLDDAALARLHRRSPLVDGTAMIDGGLAFSVDLHPAIGTLVGYRAKRHTGVIDVGLSNHYHAPDYWDEVHAEAGRIILDPGAFYILASREAVTIPPGFAAEMAPYTAMMGEFRVHYAGFFDPGFGDPSVGGAGARAVMEIRCHEAPFILEHGQGLGRLIYERMSQVPRHLYGAAVQSHYQGQGLRLSRHFRLG